MVTADEVRTIKVFEGLDDAASERLARVAADVTLVAGEDAAPEGAPRALFAVLDGRIEAVRSVDGIDRVLAVDGVTGIDITAKRNQPIRRLPEGDSYLGFIFARAATPEVVEHALRQAHACLQIDIAPTVPLTLR